MIYNEFVPMESRLTARYFAERIPLPEKRAKLMKRCTVCCKKSGGGKNLILV
jgi:hypothetical protein